MSNSWPRGRRPLIALLVAPLLLLLVVHSLVTEAQERALVAGAAESLRADPAVPIGAENPESGLSNCRYGVATPGGDDRVAWVDDLNAGWYLSFGPAIAPAANQAEFVPVIMIRQNKDANGNYLPSYTVVPALTDGQLGFIIDQYPNALWIVGNEVDRGPNPGSLVGGQGDTFPQIYAQAYHEVYHYIKNRDPSSQVAMSALVEVTPGRLQYLDLVWDAYVDLYNQPLPADVWNMHLYILPEVTPNGEPNGIANVALGTDPSLGISESYDPDGGGPGQPADTCPLDDVYCFAEHDNIGRFAEQVIAMRTWMLEHGLRNKPLVISEFSILYPYVVEGDGCYLQDENGNCFTPERVRDFLYASFDYLRQAADPQLGYPLDNNRLVQQWLWFSVSHEGVGDVSDLAELDPPGLTLIGQAFHDYVQGQPYQTNLVPDQIGTPAVISTGGLAEATLVASVRNKGEKATTTSFTVTFYSDPLLTQVIGSAEVAGPSTFYPGLAGCTRAEVKVSTVWSGLTPGLHHYWVKVDSGLTIAESNEGDNVGSGFVLVDGERASLPVVRR
jgi:hypothetical protein